MRTIKRTVYAPKKIAAINIEYADGQTRRLTIDGTNALAVMISTGGESARLIGQGTPDDLATLLTAFLLERPDVVAAKCAEQFLSAPPPTERDQ